MTYTCQVEGALKLDEAAEAGSTTIKLVIDTQTLWTKGPVSEEECPNNLNFSLTLPTTFAYQGLTYVSSLQSIKSHSDNPSFYSLYRLPTALN